MSHENESDSERIKRQLEEVTKRISDGMVVGCNSSDRYLQENGLDPLSAKQIIARSAVNLLAKMMGVILHNNPDKIRSIWAAFYRSLFDGHDEETISIPTPDECCEEFFNADETDDKIAKMVERVTASMAKKTAKKDGLKS